MNRTFLPATDPGPAATALPAPSRACVPLAGHAPKVARGQTVARGQLLAEAHAPVAGTVDQVDALGICIAAQGQAVAEPTDISALEGEALREALRGLGMDTVRLAKADTLVVNGLNPEPGVTSAEVLLRDHAPTLSAGLELARRVMGAAVCVLALRQGVTTSLSGCDSIAVDATYPRSLDPLVIKAVIGRENPVGVAALSVHELSVWDRWPGRACPASARCSPPAAAPSRSSWARRWPRC